MPTFRSPVDCKEDASIRGVSISQQLTLSALQNVVTQSQTAGNTRNVGSSPYGNHYLVFKSLAPSNCYRIDGRKGWTSATDFDTGGGPGGDFEVMCVATSGQVVIAGGSAALDDTQLRVSGNEGADWSTGTFETGASQAVALEYSYELNLWMAVTTTATYTATGSNPSGNWVNRNPGSGQYPMNSRYVLIRPAPFRALIMGHNAFPGSGTNYWVSDDMGVTWSLAPAPFDTYGLSKGVYNPVIGAWFVPTATGLYRSYDGTTWDLVDVSCPNAAIVCVDGLLIRPDGFVSRDGQWFTKVMDLPVTMTHIHAARDGAVVMCNWTTGDVAITARGTIQTY